MRTGIRHAEVFPGKLNAPPHCHALEEEIFVVLEGDGQLLLWEENGVEEHDGARGLGRLPAAGHGRRPRVPRRGAGLTLLMYGPREPGEVCYYPRSGKVYFIGLGLIVTSGRATRLLGRRGLS